MGLLEATATFFTTNTAGSVSLPYVMWEIECEPHGNCDPDQLSFKAYLSRWMAAATKVAPFTTDYVMARLAPSAQAAALACTGAGAPGYGTTCGMLWTTESWDGTSGIGQQMDALEVIQSNLISFAPEPVTANTGGTSQGDPNAGTGKPATIHTGYNIETKDKAGASILTILFGGGLVGAAVWAML
jgi:mannan endo-1,6-alpha-mannosidase